MNKDAQAPRITAEEAVERINALDASDPEGAHYAADDVLLALVPVEVHEAYVALVAKTSWWAWA